MHELLLIPWFRIEPWPLELPWDVTFHVQPFGVLAAVAMFVCSHFAAQRALQLQLPKLLVNDFLTRVTLLGIVSAYVLNIVLYSPELLTEILAQPSRLVTHWYGLSSYGGFIGGTLAACAFAYSRRASLLKLGDVWCYAFPFAWFFARLGCFCVHDHPGVPSDFALAVADWNGTGVARHDLGLYEVLWSMPVALWFWRSRLRCPAPGYYLGLVCCAYGPVRFGLDFLRADELNGGDVRYIGLTPAQFISIALAVFGLFFSLRVRAEPVTARVS
jgi:phosphatidylglycerol:prolipoprotein diacylglycerol transferase